MKTRLIKPYCYETGKGTVLKIKGTKTFFGPSWDFLHPSANYFYDDIDSARSEPDSAIRVIKQKNEKKKDTR